MGKRTLVSSTISEGGFTSREIYHERMELDVISYTDKFNDGDILEKQGDNWILIGKGLVKRRITVENYRESLLGMVEEGLESIEETRKAISKQKKDLKELEKTLIRWGENDKKYRMHLFR